jgi:hypothetical protein
LSESVQTQLSAAGVEVRGVLTVTGITHEAILRVARSARLVVLAHDRMPGETQLVTGLAAQTRLALLLVESS